MWLQSSNLIKDDQFFTVTGKMLFISQKFELECKDISKWILAYVKLKEDETLDFLDDKYNSYCEQISKYLLGRHIKEVEKVKKVLNISVNEIQTLINAKDSRNWVVHEMCHDSIAVNLFKGPYLNEIPISLGKNLTNIINGDYLVSKWSYEIHEKDSALFFSKDEYIKRLFDWVGL